MATDLEAGLFNGVAPARSLDHAPLRPERLASAKFAYTTRFLAQKVALNPQGYHLDSDLHTTPRPGDVVLAHVVTIGQHTKLESPASRRALLYPGNEIVVAYGHRYAPDQFEAEVPTNLGRTHLVAAGGVAASVTASHDDVEEPTLIAPLGLLHDGEGVVTLARVAPYAALSPVDLAARTTRPPVVAVVGTSMNSGKSTALACLTHGLTRAGLRVGAGKATGTGAGGDPGMFRDAGAQTVLDFTDFGYASTYRLDHAEVVALFVSLLGELMARGTEAVVVEIADGACQTETARLLSDPVFAEYVDRVVFTAGEALGAISGVQVLRSHGLHVAAVSGRVTASPLATREARAALDLRVVNTVDLCEPEVAIWMLPPPGTWR